MTQMLKHLVNQFKELLLFISYYRQDYNIAHLISLLLCLDVNHHQLLLYQMTWFPQEKQHIKDQGE